MVTATRSKRSSRSGYWTAGQQYDAERENKRHLDPRLRSYCTNVAKKHLGDDQRAYGSIDARGRMT